MFTNQELLLPPVIFVVYLLASALDYHSQQVQFSSYLKSKSIGKSYVVRNKFALISRGFAFILAPLLGLLVSTAPAPKDVIQLFLLCTVVSAAVAAGAFIRSSFALRSRKRVLRDVTFNGVSKLIFGGICFSVAVNAAFVTNFFALQYEDAGLWLVQLTPLCTAVATCYLIYFYDPAVANLYDNGDFTNDHFAIFMLEKLLGRFVAIFVSAGLFIAYST